MKSEKEINAYLEACKKQLKFEEKSQHYYLIHTAQIIISTLLWVLEENTLIDLNKITEGEWK